MATLSGGLKRYRCSHATAPVPVDGMLDHPVWVEAQWSDDFVDIEGDRRPKPRFRTRMKMLWDETGLYIGAEMEEPHLWATLTAHDSVIFQDHDFEVFLDPDGDHHRYVELELNALNTTWDLLLVRPYRNGGPPVDGFELTGLRTAVHLEGTLNDPKDVDSGWSVAIHIPWGAIAQVAGTRVPPKPGDMWRINFSRVEWQTEVVDGRYRKVPNTKEDNWVWAPQDVVDMHRPEAWGILEFCEQISDPVPPYPGEAERAALVAAYHAQVAHRSKHGRWASILPEVDPRIRFQTTESFFEGSLGEWRIDHESRLWRVSG